MKSQKRTHILFAVSAEWIQLLRRFCGIGFELPDGKIRFDTCGTPAAQHNSASHLRIVQKESGRPVFAEFKYIGRETIRPPAAVFPNKQEWAIKTPCHVTVPTAPQIFPSPAELIPKHLNLIYWAHNFTPDGEPMHVLFDR